MCDMNKIESIFDQIGGDIKQISEKLVTMSLQFNLIKEDNEKLRKQVEKQEKKIVKLEREIRKKNIIIKGIIDKEDEDKMETENKVQKVPQAIGVNIDRRVEKEEMSRIGKFMAHKKRPM